MEEALRNKLITSLRKKRLVSLLLVIISPIIIYFSSAAIGALFLLIFITALFGLYRFHRDLGIVTNGKFLEYKFLGYVERGRIVNKWYVPKVEDPENKKMLIADNLPGWPRDNLKVLGFKMAINISL